MSTEDTDLARWVADHADKFADPLWRLDNLYSIKSEETGAMIPFRPRPEQRQVYEDVLVRGHRKILIIKSRRRGFSTAIGVLIADAVAWREGVQCAVVDRTQTDAETKMRTIINVAFESLPAPVLATLDYPPPSRRELSCRIKGTGDTLSTAYGGKNARGGTHHILHVSEWGFVQAMDPNRSTEILTGAVPSARKGVTIVETTWAGGKRGDLYNILTQAQQIPEDQRGPDDWRVHFFPWYTDPGCSDERGYVDEVSAAYLLTLQQTLSITLTEGQRMFYARQRRDLGIFILREFPSTLEEALRAPIEGAIYAEEITTQRNKGFLGPFEVSGTEPVHTFWDLGSPANTVVWYVQMRGMEVHFIDYDADYDETIVQRVARMRDKGYSYGTHYFPHDAIQTSRTGANFLTEAQAAGLSDCVVVPRCHSEWVGINQAKQMLPLMRFRLPQCAEGVAALEAYHAEPEAGRVVKDKPVHDWSSHTADAFRCFAEASLHGLLKGRSQPARRSRRSSRTTRIIGGIR